MDYNHNLVIKGADYIVKELETEVMQNDEGTLIACMVRRQTSASLGGPAKITVP